MSTETMTLPAPLKNGRGEHLHNVDICLSIRDDMARVQIFAIHSALVDGVWVESTGPMLGEDGFWAHGAQDMHDWRSHRHLDELAEDHALSRGLVSKIDFLAESVMKNQLPGRASDGQMRAVEASHVRRAAVESLHLQALFAQWVACGVEETMDDLGHKDAWDYLAESECSEWLVEMVEDHFKGRAERDAALRMLQATIDLMKAMQS